MGNCIKHIKSFFLGLSNIHRISGKRLRQIRHIAEGGYGYVSLVEDIDTHKLYAMKKMICQSAQQKQMYFNQVKVMRDLSHCQYVVGFFGSHQIQRQDYLETYILMQYAERTVYDMLLENQKKTKGKITDFEILKIIKEVSLALSQMHKVGILHHDVKVENILLTKQGVSKICDFGSSTRQRIDLAGLSKSQIYKYQQKFQKNSTLMYRPPEMVDVYLKYPVDQRVDIWQLGCVLYVLNYKYHPFQDEGKLSIVNASVKYPKTVSPKMQKFMRHMLTPNPLYRPSLKQIIDIIDKWRTDDFQLNQVAANIMKNQLHVEKDQFEKVQKMQWHKMRPNSQWNDYQS